MPWGHLSSRDLFELIEGDSKAVLPFLGRGFRNQGLRFRTAVSCAEVPRTKTLFYEAGWHAGNHYGMKGAGMWTSLLVLVLVLIPWRAAAQPGPSSGNSTEVQVLLEFKASFVNGDEVLSSWSGSDPCEGWAGITCDSTGRVVEM